MGEIGIRRSEFLTALRWWEVQSLIRGYNARQRTGWEQARLVAYCSAFCMGGKDVPKMEDWIRFSWENKPAPPPLSEDEQKRLQNMLGEKTKEHGTDK